MRKWIHPAALALLLTAVLGQAQAGYAINTGFKPPVSLIYKQVMEEAFARIGEDVDFREVSAQRSIALANDGVDDGDCCRIEEITELFPNLVRVPVKVIDIDFVAFVRDPSITIADWDALQAYDVGVVSGWKILEQGLEKHPPKTLYTLESPDSLFGMLAKDRIQVATIGRLVGYQKLQALGYTDIHVAEPPLVSRPLYLFLHRKNADLVPRLTEALQGMRDDGTLRRIQNAVIEPLLPSPANRSK